MINFILKSKQLTVKYIKDFNSIPNMTQNIMLLSEERLFFERDKLTKNNARGNCDVNTGYIYIIKDAFCEHLLVHEFMHRLSRNQKRAGIFKKYWVSGIYDPYETVDFRGLNELMTEWLTFKITNFKENNVYQSEFANFENITQRCNLEILI